jgi:ATP-dependent Clp protease ATP-binding subunit ClpB
MTTGVKLDLSNKGRLTKLLLQQFKNRVVGQEEATQTLVNVFNKHQAGFGDTRNPAGVTLFMGPTGVGKTHVTETFAEIMLGTKLACLRIDCAEFQHSHEIAKLIGSPPGYLGHRETAPMFTQEKLDQYHTDVMKLSVILFDEIEKASDALWSLLLGILDKATLTLGDNREVKFNNSIIVLTSNLGAREMAEEGIGFSVETQECTDATQKQKALSAAKAKFTPEFMNRIGNIVVFKNQTEEQIRQVMELELDILANRLQEPSQHLCFLLEVSPAAKRALLSEGYSKVYNSRYMKRTIEHRITQPLAVLATSGQVEPGSTVVVDDTGGEDFDFWSHPTVIAVPQFDTRIGES